MNITNEPFYNTSGSLNDNDVNINGCNCINKGTGYKVDLNELSNIISKNINQSYVGKLKITKFSTIISINDISFKDNLNMAVIQNERVQIQMKIKDESVKAFVEEVINMENDCEGLLIFTTFNVSEEGMINELFLEEFHKINNLLRSIKIFNLEKDTMEKALEVGLFDTAGLDLSFKENKFSNLSQEKSDYAINTPIFSPNERETAVFLFEGDEFHDLPQEPDYAMNTPIFSPNEKETAVFLFEGYEFHDLPQEPDYAINTPIFSPNERETAIFLSEGNEFHDLPQKSNYIVNTPTFSPNEMETEVFLFEDNDKLQEEISGVRNTSNLLLNESVMSLSGSEHSDGTPKNRFNNSSAGNTRKRKGSTIEMDSHSTKKKKLSPIVLNQHIYEIIYTLQIPDVIDAVEAGIDSSENGKVEIETIRKFLGAKRLELSRCLLQMRNNYSIVDGLTAVVRKY
uniref:Rad21_Rec8 domain-containing protein n=1 Tax=Strongyloides papillosus TaxID=174720 RepID=A0A0N5CBM8_STREA